MQNTEHQATNTKYWTMAYVGKMT